MSDSSPTERLELEDERPWERGGIRRDCAPHRGPLLAWLGLASLVLGFLSLCSGLPAVIGLPLGIEGVILARRDLKEMDQGRMDPQGLQQTETGLERARSGIFLNLVFGSIYLLLVLLL